MMMIVIFDAGVRGVVAVVIVVNGERRRHYWTAMEREVAVIAVIIIIGRWTWVLTMNGAAAEEGSRCRRTMLRWDGRYHCHRSSV